MKRVAALVITVITVLTSCGGRGDRLNYGETLTGALLEWSIGDSVYRGRVSLGEEDSGGSGYRAAVVTVEQPETLAGLVVSYGESGAAASVGEADFDLPRGTGGAIYSLVRLLSFDEEDVTASDGDGITFREETPYGTLNATVTVGGDGYPTEAVAELDGEEIQVKFLEFFDSTAFPQSTAF